MTVVIGNPWRVLAQPTRRLRQRIRALRGLVLVLPVLLLPGCLGGSPPIQYYLIGTTAQSVDGVTPLAADETVELIDLSVPQYLERFELAYRTSDSRVEFDFEHQWGESLRKNLARTLAHDLSVLLGGADISTPLNRSLRAPTVRLQLFIDEFEQQADGAVTLQARWHVTGSASKGALAPAVATYQGQWRGTRVDLRNFDAVVAQMQELFGRCSRAVAESVQTRMRVAPARDLDADS